MPDVSDEIFEVAFVSLARRVDHGDPLQTALRVALNAVATEWNAATSLPDLAASLRQITTDIEGHIDRRAQEIAAERIEAAEDAASDRVAAVVRDLTDRLAGAQSERQRAGDLLAELRRRLGPLERQQQAASEARRQLAELLGHQPGAHQMTSLVTEVGELLTHLRAPLLSDPERWQIEEARDMLDRLPIQVTQPPTERLLAEHTARLLAFIDQIAPKGGPRG